MLFYILDRLGGKMWEASWNEATKALQKKKKRPQFPDLLTALEKPGME